MRRGIKYEEIFRPIRCCWTNAKKCVGAQIECIEGSALLQLALLKCLLYRQLSRYSISRRCCNLKQWYCYAVQTVVHVQKRKKYSNRCQMTKSVWLQTTILSRVIRFRVRLNVLKMKHFRLSMQAVRVLVPSSVRPRTSHGRLQSVLP